MYGDVFLCCQWLKTCLTELAGYQFLCLRCRFSKNPLDEVHRNLFLLFRKSRLGTSCSTSLLDYKDYRKSFHEKSICPSSRTYTVLQYEWIHKLSSFPTFLSSPPLSSFIPEECFLPFTPKTPACQIYVSPVFCAIHIKRKKGAIP